MEAKPMKQVTITIDGSIRIPDLARALSVIGYTLSIDANGDMRASKRRVRKPGVAEKK